ncbi:MAG: RNA-binding protein [Thermoplasmata archaeon]|nr:MAG: RNA-binding protein [Thermoplasmata archaeon]
MSGDLGMIKHEELIIPGQELGTLEEYLPGENVYERDGKLYSKVFGKVSVKNLRISVHPLKEIPRIKEGEVVIATVTEVKENVAIVEILAIEGEAYRGIASPIYTAAIPISQIANEFIKDIRLKLRASDIVRARVISTQKGIFLTIKPPDMGVINAFCSICRRPLRRVSGNTLRCDHCNTNETRKLSNLYGKYFMRGDKYGSDPRKI